MTKKNKPDAGQSRAEDDTSKAASLSQDDANDMQAGQGDAPVTGPFAHDPAKVWVPANPATRAPHPETVDADATSPTGAEETAETAPDAPDAPWDTDTADTDTPDMVADTPEDRDDSAAPIAERPGDDTRRADAPTPKPEQVTIRQGGFWSMLFGGALAASIGVIASPYILSSDMLEGRVPAFLAPQQQGDDEIDAQLTAQQDRLDAVQARLDALSTDIEAAMDRPDPAPDLSDDVAGLTETLRRVESRFGGIEEQISDTGVRIGEAERRIGTLGNRLTAVENRAVPTADDSEISSSEIEDLRARLEAQRADIEAQRSEIEAQQSDVAARQSDLAAQGSDIEALRETLAAQRDEIAALREAADAEEAAARDSARATLQKAALSRVMTALDTGSPFADAVGDLRDTGIEVPDALADAAQTGVPTRPDLIDSFPDAARAALSNVRDANEGLGAVEIGDFFRSQLGMRSLVPREGDDPDAILSRAEAALRDARIGDALAEVDALPEQARAALDDWVARATQREQALSAADALADRLN